MFNIKTEIFLGDCRDILKNIKSNSVDLVFTSPPYADSSKKTCGE
jgi:DNA modification methylase